MTSPNKFIRFSAEVEAALADGRPLVALESTIITHGMPWPQNRDTALLVEATVRNNGAVPATIAVIDGLIHVGLSDDELTKLSQNTDVMKLSRADFAACLSTGATGSTTVAATMIAAKLAGIAVFATGGIGGVHRGAENSFDISADLEELSKTNVIVVCAGAKAILDLPKTLEVLETNGVPVVVYGADDAPAFWSRSSGLPAPLRHDDAGAIARHWATRNALEIKGGMLVANPVPEASEIPRKEMQAYIETALQEASKQGVTGKDVTPFLLGHIVELTEGRSLKTNVDLIVNNAALAAKIAVELTRQPVS